MSIVINNSINFYQLNNIIYKKIKIKKKMNKKLKHFKKIIYKLIKLNQKMIYIKVQFFNMICSKKHRVKY